MAINPQKLLPQSQQKGGNLAKVSSSNLSLNIGIKKIDTKKLIGSNDDEKQLENITKTLINIDSLLKSSLSEDKKNENKKRKEKEKKDFDAAEQKLEAPKESKKFNLPSLSIPGMGFLDRIKRFIFFTALGWLFTKFQDQLPKLLGIVKIIGGVYGVAENIFKFLLETFVNFIDRGYKVYDKTREIVKSIGGEKAEKDFDNLSGKLNEYINYVLIGGMALTGAIKGFNSQSRKVAEKVTANAAKQAAGKVATGAAKQAAGKVATGAAKQAAGKVATRQLLRLVKGPLTKLPILGGLIEFGLSYALGEPVGKAAFRGIGTILLGAVGSLIMPGFGTFVGGWAGAELAAKLYEVLFENKKPEGSIQGKASGGSVTRGGVSINRPIGRTSGAPQQNSRKNKKLIAQPSKPGKNVGGEKKIKTLYPNSGEALSVTDWMNATDAAGDPYPGTFEDYKKEKEKGGKKPNPYKALTNTSKILKKGGEAGILMAAGVDLAMGQDLDTNFSNAFSKDTLLKSKVSEVIQNIKKELSKKVMGGAKETPSPDAGGGGTAGGEYGGYTPQSGLQKEIYDYLVNVKKLSDVQALGLMANINRESSFIPSNINTSSGATGLFQWLGGRATAMKKAVPNWQNNWKGQIDYALIEPKNLSMVTPGEYQSKTFNSALEASVWWADEWERPGIDVRSKHEAYLKSVPKAPNGTAKFREGESASSTIVKGGKIKGGAIVTQRNDPDAEQTGLDIALGNYQVGANIQNPFQSLKITDVGIHGSGSGNTGNGYGNYVTGETIINGKRYEILLGHLNRSLVKKGDILEYGDVIGLQGISGHAKGPHVTTHVNALNGGDPRSVLTSVENVWTNGGMIETKSMGDPTSKKQPSTKIKPGQPPSLTRQDIITIKQGKGKTGTQWTDQPPNNKTQNQPQPSAKQQPRNWWDPLGVFVTPSQPPSTKEQPIKQGGSDFNSAIPQNQKGGGLIGQPNKRNYSSLSSYPSYDGGGGMMLAIQPIIIEKPVPILSGGNKTVMFPVLVGVNNSNMASLSRG